MKMPKFKPCPFCGKEESVEFISESDMAKMNNGVRGGDGWYVICNATNFGCGSASGYGGTQLEALGIWNNSRQFDKKVIEVDEKTIIDILMRLNKLEQEKDK